MQQRLQAMPTSIDAVTNDWLTETLIAAGHQVEIAGFEATRIGNGMLGTAQRLVLAFVGGKQADAPSSLVMKYATAGERGRRTGRVGFGFPGRPGFFSAEVIFYSRYAPKLEIRTPRCFASWVSSAGDDFTLLLEDIAPSTAGNEFSGTSAQRSIAACTQLAGLHGPSWGLKGILDGQEFEHPTRVREAEFYGRVVRRNVEVLTERGQLLAEGRGLELVQLFAAHADEWFLGMGGPASLVHGDYRLDNLLFPENEPTAVAVDWQTFSPGFAARDLGMFLGASVPTHLRRRHQDALLSAYHTRLLELGVTGHDESATENLLRVGVFHGVHNMLTILRATDIDDRGRHLAETWLDRAVATADDLNSWSVFA